MKTYQVVNAYSTDKGCLVVRNQQRIYEFGSYYLDSALETVMNLYAQDGWTVKAVTSLNALRDSIYVTFEKDL